jgi:hypothetical protein
MNIVFGRDCMPARGQARRLDDLRRIHAITIGDGRVLRRVM